MSTGMPAPPVTFRVTAVAVIVKFITIGVAAVPAGAAAGASIDPVHLLAVWAYPNAAVTTKAASTNKNFNFMLFLHIQL
jgi:hypothetical protein